MSMFDWRSRKAKALVRQAWDLALPLIRFDVAKRFASFGVSASPAGTSTDASAQRIAASNRATPAANRPTIYISACVDAATPGGWKYNGGIKEFNLLSKLLRAKGYEAFIVTYDGTCEPWLIEHQAVISLAELDRRMATGEEARHVTSWVIAESYLSRLKRFYLWDMELRFTANEHFPLLFKFYRDHRIVSTAGISRTVQAWHMAHFERTCTIIPNLIDHELWFDAPDRRVRGRIGYMDEGPHTADFIDQAGRLLVEQGIPHELLKVSGDERACRDLMQTCDLFVNMNIGKDPFWGEGCPRTIIESMATGCVNLSFDIIGNREVVIPGLNAVLIPDKTPSSLATSIAQMLQDQPALEAMRIRSREVLSTCHTFEQRWPSIKKFLDL